MKQLHGVLVGLLGVVLVLALVTDATRTSTKAFIALFFVLNLLAFRREYRDDDAGGVRDRSVPGQVRDRSVDAPDPPRGPDDPAPR